jgi:cytidylate kinase
VDKSPGIVPVIAIDGPTASGKGTIASRVAANLGFHYLESGALYRLVALAGGEPVAAAKGLQVAFRGGRIFLKEQDVTDRLREEAVGNRASEIAPMAAVRSGLLERQRGFRKAPGLVADGRDMGTVVFPDAALKIYLTATVQVRAQRRYKQLIDKGIHANLTALSRELEERDRRDVTRAVAPLKPAADAVQIDSSTLAIDQVVDLIVKQYREKTGGKA